MRYTELWMLIFIEQLVTIWRGVHSDPSVYLRVAELNETECVLASPELLLQLTRTINSIRVWLLLDYCAGSADTIND
jgi:hypothetical protein